MKNRLRRDPSLETKARIAALLEEKKRQRETSKPPGGFSLKKTRTHEANYRAYMRIAAVAAVS